MSNIGRNFDAFFIVSLSNTNTIKRIADMTEARKKYSLNELIQGELLRRASLTPEERADEDETVRLFESAAPVGREFGAKKTRRDQKSPKCRQLK